MPDEIQELKIQVKVDAQTGKLQVFGEGVDKLEKNLNKASKSGDDFKKNLDKLGSSLGINIGQFTTMAGVDRKSVV